MDPWAPSSSTPWWNAPSSPLPIARPTTATPNFVPVPLEALLSDDYNAERRSLVGRDGVAGTAARQHPRLSRRSSITRPPARARFAARRARGRRRADRRAARARSARDTCHLDVIDRHGNMVSATPSGGWLQSSPVIPGLGFLPGHARPDVLAAAGLPNSLAPGKRPRTTLSPSFALRDGKPWMAFGTPGGEQQDQWSLIFFLRMVHHDMGIQEAIDAPAFHTEHWPSSFWPRVARPGKVVMEGRYPDAVLDALLRARPRGRERRRLERRAAFRRAARAGRADVRRRQSARHARLRGGTLMLSPARRCVEL